MTGKRTPWLSKSSEVVSMYGLCLLLLVRTTLTWAGSYDLPGSFGGGEAFADPGPACPHVPLTGEVIWFETFESGWGDWYTDAGVWLFGKPTSGPGAPFCGQAVAATNLSGAYPGDTDSRLISPVVILPAVGKDEQLEIRLWQWYSYAGGDVGHVQIHVWDGSKWGNWTTVFTPTAESTNSNWSPVAAELTAFAGQTVQIAFYHTAYHSPTRGEAAGWYIDDLYVWKGTPAFTNPQPFEFGWEDSSTDAGVWEIGRPVLAPPSPVANGASGGSCAGTVLSGNYPPDTDSRLVLPTVVLPASASLKLRFWQWYSYAGGDVGHVQIRVWDGGKWGNWTTVFTPTAESTNSNWSPVAAELTAFAGQTAQIAFYHTAYHSPTRGEAAGWYIDDVQITPAPPVVAPACSLTISVAGRGLTDPDVGVHSYPRGQIVAVTALLDDCHPFVRWEGTAVEAGKVSPDATSPAIAVVVDGQYTLKAVFADEVVLYEFPLDSDPRWTLAGQWGFGVPKGQGGQSYGCPDPTSGHTGRHVLGVNLSGDYDAKVGGPHSLTAGPFDLSAFRNVKVRFARWLNTDWPEYVRIGLDVSVDGQRTWTSVWSHDASRTEITDCQWIVVEYELGRQVDGQSQVHLKWWYAVVGERAYAYSGWNIDDIQLIGCIGSQAEHLPDPALVFTGTENYQANGQRWTRYRLSVSNRNEYPAALFAPAPDLAPCGLNTSASRTWVEIFKADGTYLYGFCALSQPEDMDGLWFALPQGSSPPSGVYITLEDRQCGTTYTSNLVGLMNPAVAASSGL